MCIHWVGRRASAQEGGSVAGQVADNDTTCHSVLYPCRRLTRYYTQEHHALARTGRWPGVGMWECMWTHRQSGGRANKEGVCVHGHVGEQVGASAQEGGRVLGGKLRAPNSVLPTPAFAVDRQYTQSEHAVHSSRLAHPI